jgi:MFS family permease
MRTAPATDPTAATLASLATFAIAFIARPIGSALFGHFGDRIGRKATLVAALLRCFRPRCATAAPR